MVGEMEKESFCLCTKKLNCLGWIWLEVVCLGTESLHRIWVTSLPFKLFPSISSYSQITGSLIHSLIHSSVIVEHLGTKHYTMLSSVQFSSVAQSCPTLCDPMNRSTPGLPVHHQLLEFTRLMSIESVMPSSHLILCCSLLLLPPIPPSIRVFSNESTLHMRWPKYWSFSFSIIPSNEHPGLISFRMDWLDLRAVQGTLKSPLQHHSSKASILLLWPFFRV